MGEDVKLRFIHGSEDSLDTDVVYIFDELPSFRECQAFCASKEENRNIAAVREGTVSACFKGVPDEINNGLFYTCALHPQAHPNAVLRAVERDVLMKCVRVARCLLSHCSRTVYRESVKRALESAGWEERIQALRAIDFTAISDYGKKARREDALKTFAFQIGQVLGLLEGTELYTKSAASSRFPELRKYLYREEGSDASDLSFFIGEFLNRASKLKAEAQDGAVYFSAFGKTINLKNETYIGQANFAKKSAP